MFNFKGISPIPHVGAVEQIDEKNRAAKIIITFILIFVAVILGLSTAITMSGVDHIDANAIANSPEMMLCYSIFRLIIELIFIIVTIFLLLFAGYKLLKSKKKGL